jgi:cation diffusion facilitator family transporter
MAVEIAGGIAFGSMALLADGLHMGSHASALAISAFAYYYTRRHAKDARFNFGTGKVSSLAGFAGAVVLVLFALVMAWESIARFISPVAIGFTQAILVAVLGLIVNGICLLILGGHGHSHGQSRREEDGGDHDGHAHEHPDHNFRSAYLHVLADALTSLLAIFALLAGKYLAQGWLDPFMGVVGAALVVRWSWGLLHSSARVLLDMQAPEELGGKIREAIESEGDHRISDMHVWSVGPGLYAAEIAVVSSQPLETAGYYDLLPENLGIVHITVETHRCASSALKAL